MASIKNSVNFDKVLEAERKAKAHALMRQGQAIVSQAQKDKLVPIETGTLRRSAVVTLGYLPNPENTFQVAEKLTGNERVKDDDPNQSANADRAWVSYNTPYAEHLHESTDWHPAPPLEEGGPKWMEKSLAACKDKFPDILANTLKEHGF